MTERMEIRFTGRVQGVGFRYTTRRVAGGFDVAGWVRNEPDGSVRCVAEGPPDQLEAFLAGVEEAMAGHIADREVTRGAASGGFEGFTIER